MEVVTFNGVDITDDLRLIWMIDTARVIGSNNTEKYFIKRKQYRYDSKGSDPIGVGEDCYKFDRKDYYLVTDEFGETFKVPSSYCIEDDKPRKVWEQDETSWLDHKSDQPKDYIQEYKDITGIDLIDQNMPVTNGGDDLWNEFLQKRNEGKGKQYGQVELREEFPI